MDWMVGVAQLDAAQRRTINTVVKNLDEDHWISGFAGTGKTIVLTHILKRIAASQETSGCFATYTHALKEMVESGLSAKELQKIRTTTFPGLAGIRDQYDVVVADEFQDIRDIWLDEIRAKSQSVVFAADPAQRIYRWNKHRDLLETEMDQAVVHRLRTIHRINLPVYTTAVTVYPDAGLSPGEIPEDDNEPVEIMKHTSISEEVDVIQTEAVRLTRPGSPSAILLPSRALMQDFIDNLAQINDWSTPPELQRTMTTEGSFDVWNEYLAENNSVIQVFGSKSGSLADSDAKPVIYLISYHSAKGLEFPYVFMPHLTKATKLEPMVGASEEEEQRQFYVASTRAKEKLFLSYFGTPHRFLGRVEKLGDDIVRQFPRRKPRY